VEIGDEVRKQTAAHSAIAELLNTLPHLKHYGYVSVPVDSAAQ
jgi:hypothetical protein